MPFNRNEPNNDDGTTFYSNVATYSDTDFENDTIFVPLDTSFNVSFTQTITAETVTVRTQNTDVDVADRNKRGSIQLSSVVQSTKGTASDALNLRALKATSDPAFTNDEAGTPPVLAKDQTADIEVEMENQPSPINPTTIDETDFFSNFSFKPVVNLASNTTYFFNVTPDVKDSFDKPVSLTVGKGFVTDNTKSVITLSNPILGYRVALRDDFDGTYNEGEIILKKGRSTPTAKIVKQEKTSKITYQLELTSFKMNVAYSAANPCVVTSTAHGLAVNDVITIYDIVSGTGLKKQRYTVGSISTDAFVLRNTDTSGFTAGRINYYVNFDNGDIITTDRTDTENIETVIKSRPREVFEDYEMNKLISKVKGSSSGDAFARLIRVDGQTLNYIPIVASDTKEVTSTDSFSNNMIIEQETDNGTLRSFVSANTSPTNNVHPFHTNAPIVTGYDPDAEASMTPTVRILSLTRDNLTATVETNSPHFLSEGDSIVIEGSDQTSYNGTKTITSTPTSNSFTYDVTGSPASPATGGKILLKISGNEQATSFGIDFSQSMNTSTITVANNSHIISANGTSATFSGGQNKASSTIQLSYDEFENLVNIASISANTGNSHFDIIPETLVNARPYKIRVTTACQDLGTTNVEYTNSPDTTFATGLKLFDPTTGKEVIFKDTDPPEIRKISFSTTGSGDVSGKVLESNTASEISNPEDLDTASINLNDESIIVQFTESMNTQSITVNTSDTLPGGSIQMSCDDFETIVQMASAPTVTTTSYLNDTFTFAPKANLSANSNYTVKVKTDVADESENQNFLVTENVSRNKIMTLAAEPSAAYTVGEIIKGTGTLTIRANTGTFVEGLTTGEVIVGDTSLAKGKVYDLNVQTSLIRSIRYTEIPSADDKVHPFIPGENITGENGGTASLSNTSITIPPQGKVISYDNSNPYKITYRQINTERAFTAGSSSANDRVVGVSSNSYGKTSVSTDIVGPGIKTTTTAITVDALFRKPDDSIVSISGGNQTGIDVDSNVIVKFNQTMNVDSIVINATDSTVGSENIILSYDSNFANCIPLQGDFSSSNNDSTFEFKPLILSNTSLQLTQNKNLFCKVIRTIKNKGNMNLASASTFSGNYANVATSLSFSALNASVYTDGGTEVVLGTGTSGSMPNQSSSISRSSAIVIHFNESVLLSTFAIGSGNEIQLSTASGFGSGHVTSVSLVKTGEFGNLIMLAPTSLLTAGTRYYLRVVHGVGGTNEGGKALAATVYFNSFTTVS